MLNAIVTILAHNHNRSSTGQPKNRQTQWLYTDKTQLNPLSHCTMEAYENKNYFFAHCCVAQLIILLSMATYLRFVLSFCMAEIWRKDLQVQLHKKHNASTHHDYVAYEFSCNWDLNVFKSLGFLNLRLSIYSPVPNMQYLEGPSSSG